MNEGSGLNVVAGRRLRRVSDGVIVLSKLGNAGGGKDAHQLRRRSNGSGKGSTATYGYTASG